MVAMSAEKPFTVTVLPERSGRVMSPVMPIGMVVLPMSLAEAYAFAEAVSLMFLPFSLIRRWSMPKAIVSDPDLTAAKRLSTLRPILFLLSFLVSNRPLKLTSFRLTRADRLSPLSV